ncbi:MAG TPA: sigma-54 dependent transcriptional regulator, partial [Bryobacteraceae bacterium]|nr:sigma-54 dependent transcriptional regulator [Bryobacteraceae bacterium]
MNTILVAEDELEVRNYLGLALSCEGYRVEYAQNGEEVLQCLASRSSNVSLLLLDLLMPIKNGFETLQEVRRDWPALPVITLSGSCTTANVATVLKNGATDFLSKPVGHDDLLKAIRAALPPPPSAQVVVFSRTETPGESFCVADSAILPTSPWSQKAEALVTQVGASDVPVLMRGETGVGKEIFARKLHERSKRAGRPFLKLNCAALPSELIESELFGYERGAFTGAFKNTPGKFEMANNGTILLDEIGDMDFKLQAKLLQVLQDREFLRLGAKDASRVDVRVMAATHCDLEKAIIEKRFREDLYYRLNIIEIHIPPLRDRRDEIISLAEFFLRKYSPADNAPELPSAVRQALVEYDWPGNVRELENVMRKFLVFRNMDLIVDDLQRKRRRSRPTPISASTTVLPAEDLAQEVTPVLDRLDSAPVEREHSPELLRMTDGVMELRVKAVEFKQEQVSPAPSFEPCVEDQPEQPSVLAKVDRARREAETQAIVAALNATLWNRKRAASLLNIDYKALLYKMK